MEDQLPLSLLDEAEEEEPSAKTDCRSHRPLISPQMGSFQEDGNTPGQPEVNCGETDSFLEDGIAPKQPEVNGEEMDSFQEDGSSPKQQVMSPEMNVKNKNSNEEIMKELKNIKRQNFITHCLLSAMIMITLTWQISEVSMILKIKNGLSNPLKLLGGLTKGLLAKERPEDAQEPPPNGKNGIEPPQLLPGLKIPEIPLLDLPIFDASDDD